MTTFSRRHLVGKDEDGNDGRTMTLTADTSFEEFVAARGRALWRTAW